MMTPPFSISAKPRFTRNVPVSRSRPDPLLRTRHGTGSVPPGLLRPHGLGALQPAACEEPLLRDRWRRALRNQIDPRVAGSERDDLAGLRLEFVTAPMTGRTHLPAISTPLRRIHAFPVPVRVTSGEWYPKTSTRLPSVTTTCWITTFAAVMGVPVSSVIGASWSIRSHRPLAGSHFQVAFTDEENAIETLATCLPTEGAVGSNFSSRRGGPSLAVRFAAFVRSLAVLTKRLCGSTRLGSRQNASPPVVSSKLMRPACRGRARPRAGRPSRRSPGADRIGSMPWGRSCGRYGPDRPWASPCIGTTP